MYVIYATVRSERNANLKKKKRKRKENLSKLEEYKKIGKNFFHFALNYLGCIAYE
jgi:hypothetical protein